MGIKELLEKAYLLGFLASGEGYNGEFPFEFKNVEENEYWLNDRELAVIDLLQLFEKGSKSLNDGKIEKLEKFWVNGSKKIAHLEKLVDALKTCATCKHEFVCMGGGDKCTIGTMDTWEIDPRLLED